MKYTIRPALPEDAAKFASLNQVVQNLHADHFPKLFRINDGQQEIVDVFRSALSDSNCYGYLALDDKEDPVAYSLCSHEKRSRWFWHGHSVFCIDQISVLPSWQHQGVGKAFVELAIAEGKRLGVDYIDADYWSFNDPSKGLFASCKFKPIRTFVRLELQ